MQKKKALWSAALAVTLGLLTALVLLLHSSGFFEAARSQEGLRRYIERYAPYSHLVFFVLQLSSVILAPIPSNVIAAVGGLLFGTLPAFLLTTCAVLLGSAVVFALGRALGRPFAERFAGRGKLEKYAEVIRRKQNTFFFLAFLFPFFPDDLLCIAAGLTDIPFGRFFLLAALARPWGLLAASALGGSAFRVPVWGMALLGAAGLALFLLALRYGDRFEAALMEHLKKEDSNPGGVHGPE